VSTVAEAVDLIDEVGLANIDILIDTWHFWDDPTAARDVARFAERIVGVQLADRRSGARGTMDRSLPGKGDLDLSAIMRMIRASSFRGWYDLELMSDDGTFGNAYADSLWKMDPVALVRAGVASFQELWRESGAQA
jgi:sugar phosphate isomerase/epimerase